MSAPFELLHGASWLTLEGEVLEVPGFHEEWLREHEELAQGSRNVCELVLRRRWISVALFSEGYVELMVADKSSPDIVMAIFRLLSGRPGSWARALVMSMGEEGYALLSPADLAGPEALAAALGRPL
jgi:hypothetical protein